jgi:WD40 repeat protein
VLEGHKGTVWGVAWEGKEREDNKFPRLATHSADGNIRVWKLREDGDKNDTNTTVPARGIMSGLGGIPNTMRRSIKEDWDCDAILPKVHDGDIYSVSWSSRTGLMVSTGSDGVVALYCEDAEDSTQDTRSVEGAANDSEELPGSRRWKVLTTVPNAHGGYEINHITWCPRYDAASEKKKGFEEMLVTTGDDGLIRTWEVSVAS